MRFNKQLSAMLVTSALLIGAPSIRAFSSSPLKYKSFVNGPALWISDPSGILMYRSDTRAVRTIVLSDTVENDSIFDIAENNKVLSVLAQSGIYQIDLATTTVEKLPGNKTGNPSGRLTVDDDYLWAALDDTLWRFDKLGREWFPYTINSPSSSFRGIYSNGTNVYCVLSASVKIFSTKDEKWLEFPYKKGMTISPEARFFIDKNTLVLIDGAFVYRYLIASQSWDIINAQTPIIDMLPQDTALFYLTGKDIYKYSTAASVTQPLNIPGIAQARCFTRLADSLVCATNGNFVTFDLNAKTTNNILLPLNISDPALCKLFLLGSTLVALYPKDISAYNPDTRLWENVALASAGTAKRKIASWDENGLRVRYSKGYESQLKGSIGENLIVDSATVQRGSTIIKRDTVALRSDTVKLPDTGFVSYQFPYSNHAPFTETNLTLHNTLPDGRYWDMFLDNTGVKQVPTKGVFYRGATSDNVESARLGTNTFSVAQSQTLPTTQFEGINAVVQSKSSLSTRDRRIVKVQAGTGLITAKTIYKVLDYSETGVYKIKFSNQSINDPNAPMDFLAPGTFKVYIDGEQVDSTNYTFTPPPAGTLIFSPDVIIDRTSLITISYQLQQAHQPVKNIEWLPTNNAGEFGYANISVSPTDWISPQIGFYHLETDKVHELINAAVPVEFRTTSFLRFLKLNPEITFDQATSKKAMGLALQSRFGEKTSLIFNGLLPDSGFATTDNLERGYGGLKHNANATLSYDITKELPLSYYQSDIQSQFGFERRYQLTAGAHFLNTPFFDVSLSRNIANGDLHDTVKYQQLNKVINYDTIRNPNDTIIDTVITFDTTFTDTVVPKLNRNKDKLLFRLYETSSPFVESFLHINRINYDVSYLLFKSRKENVDSWDTASGIVSPLDISEKEGLGSALYGNITISPIKRLSLTGIGHFMANPEGSRYRNEWAPILMLQTIDAPPGFDINAQDQVTFKSLADSNASYGTILRSANITLKPGAWFAFMSWMQPFYWIQEQMICNFDTSNPGISHLFFDDRDVSSKSLTHTVGVNLFPTNDIVYNNKNQWTTADSITIFYTFNDIKWHFGEKRFWQTRWEWDHDRPREDRMRPNGSGKRDFHRGFSQFTNTWLPWLQTITGITSNFVSTDSTAVTNTGPEVTASISTQNRGFIKMLMNSHTLNVSWQNAHGRTQSSPDIIYSMTLKLVVAPNLSLDMYDNFSLLNSTFSKYNGNMSIKMLF